MDSLEWAKLVDEELDATTAPITEEEIEQLAHAEQCLDNPKLAYNDIVEAIANPWPYETSPTSESYRFKGMRQSYALEPRQLTGAHFITTMRSSQSWLVS